MEIIVGIVAGVALGAGVVWLVARGRPEPDVDGLVRRATTEAVRSASAEQTRALLEQNQALLAGERVLSGEHLDGKKSLIDQQLSSMSDELRRVTDLVGSLEAERSRKLGELTGALEAQRENVALLAETTHGLRQALSSSKARGQWGERMADDVLRLHGFVEGLNYRKQRAIAAGVPDFTFFLPAGMLLHMDVKFPLDNYLRYLDADSEIAQRRSRDDFLRDVRNHVKTLAARGYSGATDETVDCVLLFIPNEAVYGFIQEQDRTILDDALGRKLIFCSPVTLYAVLAVVRQAVDNFAVERTSNEILVRLSAFGKQWSAFVEKMEKLDRSLGTARRDFDELSGTRRRQLERELDKIEDLRRAPELSLESDDDDGNPPLALEA